MIIDHKKIENNQKVVFETIVCNTDSTLNFRLNNEAYFTYVNHGHHVAISPNEIIEVPEGDLGVAVGKSLILKAYPNKDRPALSSAYYSHKTESLLQKLSVTNFQTLILLQKMSLARI